MKKTIPILFLSLIIFQNVAVFSVLLSFSLNRNYISNNLCENRANKKMHCNGKCYLNRQLRALERKNQSDKAFKLLELPSFCQSSICFQFFDLAVTKSNFFPLKSNYCIQSLFAVFRPPPWA